MYPKARFFDPFSSRPRPRDEEVLRPAVTNGGADVRALLAARTSRDLSPHEIRTMVEGSLWMLGPVAFRYFLPAFMHAVLESYEDVSVFASELVGALTEPSRADVVEALDRVTQLPSGLGLADDTAEQLSAQQLEWFDSGTPLSIFRERIDDLSAAEGATVLDFFRALDEVHGEDFPFGELETAIERHWSRYED